MEALSTLFPVLFMVMLGLISRIKGFVTPEQKEGANTIVFHVLFPILIFNILLTSQIESSAIMIVLYVFIVFCLAMLIGKILGKVTGKQFSHISQFMLTTCEGGNVALPLYTSIVGVAYASHTVIFDLAGTLVAFVVIPILVAKLSAGKTTLKELLKTIFSNSFVIAVILGLVFNLTGIYEMFSKTPFIDVYTNTIAVATAPIMGMILFIIGYNLKINLETIGPLLKLLVVRVVYYIAVIVGFFILFPHLMADKTYMIAVLIYFMCPTGFALPMQISPLYKSDEDANYTSAFISLNMIVTLIVYAVVVIFIA
ncbi:MAG: AEC family transporter [Longibaculum sp.]